MGPPTSGRDAVITPAAIAGAGLWANQ